jgi:hypothetical protein
MTWNPTTTRRALAGMLLAACGALGACRDAPLEPGPAPARPDGPARLLNAACGGTGGITHPGGTLTASITWTRAGSPHRITGHVRVEGGARLTVAPGAVLCFDPVASLEARNGGYMYLIGVDSARIVLTARDPAVGWWGVGFTGTPPAGYRSYVTFARVEHVAREFVALHSDGRHAVYVESTVIRQTGQAVYLLAPNSRLTRSRVDTTTHRTQPAVMLGDSTVFSATTVRRAAGVGVLVSGVGVQLAGGRIEGSGGAGLVVETAVASAKPVRIVGGRAHPAELTLAALARIYPSPADQDSLLGNARDTLYILGGPLAAQLTVRPALPWRIRDTGAVEASGILRAEPGAALVFDPGAGLYLHAGGRILARGSAAAPVLFTAEDPAIGWTGIYLDAVSTVASYLTNVRIEHTSLANTAVTAVGVHTVYLDSAVLRQNGVAAWLTSPNSRLVRTRVDSTLAPTAAVTLGSSARIESTLIRASSGAGLAVLDNTVRVLSCDIRGSVDEGIVLHAAVQVRNCNLADNLDVGIRNMAGPAVIDAENNWWGDGAGPGGPAGDGVGALVDFTPFRTAPYVLPYVP